MGGRYIESTAKKSNQSKRLKSLASSGSHLVRRLSSSGHNSSCFKPFLPLAVLDHGSPRHHLDYRVSDIHLCHTENQAQDMAL